MTKFTNSKGEPISDREGLRAAVKDNFFKLGQIVDNANAAKDAYLTALAAVDKLSKDYTPEYLAAKKQAATGEYRAKGQVLYADAQKTFEKLQSALLEIHSQLDLNDPALTNAVSLIKNVGPELSFEDKLKINASFAANQPALKLLQSAYKSAGVLSDGGLDKQIYDPEGAVQSLGKYAQAALLGDGFSPFRFGVEIGKVASLEGYGYDVFPWANPFPSQVETPPTVDAGKVYAAARAAAGLPSEAK